MGYMQNTVQCLTEIKYSINITVILPFIPTLGSYSNLHLSLSYYCDDMTVCSGRTQTVFYHLFIPTTRHNIYNITGP